MKSLSEKFHTKVEKTRTCWWWTGALVGNGYGQLGRQYAHRVGYNAAYLDGHAVWKPDQDLFMFYSPVKKGDWNSQEQRWQSFFDN